MSITTDRVLLPPELLAEKKRALAALRTRIEQETARRELASEANREALDRAVCAVVPEVLRPFLGDIDADLRSDKYTVRIEVPGHAVICAKFSRAGIEPEPIWLQEYWDHPNDDPITPGVPPMWAIYLDMGDSLHATTLGAALALADLREREGPAPPF